MAIHGGPIPLMNDGNFQSDHDNPPVYNGLPRANFDTKQPVLRSPIEIAGKGKGIEVSTTRPANHQAANASAIFSDEKDIGDSAMNGDASIQKQGSFDSKLGDLERMLVLWQKMDPDSPKAFDDIIRTQIETLVPEFHVENRESSIARYVERLAEVRNHILSQWESMDHNGWNGDCDHSTKRIDQITVEMMRIMDVESNSGLMRDLDPLTALESLSKIKDKLFDKGGLEKYVEALMEQKTRALSLAQHFRSQASHGCPVLLMILTDRRSVQTVDAFNRGRAEAIMLHRATKDRAADVEDQALNFKNDLERADEKIPQAEWKHWSHVGNVPSNANAWATPISSSIPTQWTPSISNATLPEALGCPIEASNLSPPTANMRPTKVAMSSNPQIMSYCPIGSNKASPNGLLGSPVINPVEQRRYDYGGVGHDLGRDDRSSFGLSNRPMPPNVPKRTYDEYLRQRRETSINQLHGPSGLTRANQGARRRGGRCCDCGQCKHGGWRSCRGRVYHGRDGRG